MATAVGAAVANAVIGTSAAATASFAYAAVSTAATLAASYAISELATRALGSDEGTEGSTKTQNFASANNAARILLGRNKVGGDRWLLKATDEHIVYGIIHGDGPIEAIDKVWIGDKTSDHSDFSNVEMTQYTTYLSGAYNSTGSSSIDSSNATSGIIGIGNKVPVKIFYTFNEPIVISSYKILRNATVPDDTDSPEDFTLEGSNDGSTWYSLDLQSGQLLIDSAIPTTYTVTTSTAYSHYRLTVTKANVGDEVRINEFTVFGVTESGVSTGGDVDLQITIDGDIQTFSETVTTGQDAEDIRDLLYEQLIAHGYNNLSFDKTKKEILSQESENDRIEYGIITKRTYGTTTAWDFDLLVTNNTLETGLTVDNTKDAGHEETKRYIEVVTGLGEVDQQANDRLLEVLPSTYYDAETFRAQGKCWTTIIIDKSFYKESLGNVPAITSEIRGRNDIPNSRTGAIGYSENPIDLWVWYLKSNYYYEATGRKIYADQLPESWIIADANLCDEQVQYNADGDTHARYAYNGSILVDSTVGSIMEGFAASVNTSAPVPIGGAFRMRPMAYHQPSKTINVSDLADDWSYIPKPPADENYDSATGSYVHADQNYATESYPIVYLDGADTLSPTIKQIDFLAEVDPYRAQRNAGNHIRALKDRATYSIKTKVLNFELSPTDTVYLEVPNRDTKAFYVESTTRDNMTQQYEYILTSHDAGDYSDDYSNFTEVEIVEVDSAITVRDDLTEDTE